jgi:hypothetical protein
MARPARVKRPIMTREQKRSMSFEGLLQRTHAVVRQSERLATLDVQSREHWEKRPEYSSVEDQKARVAAMHEATLTRHTECHFFAITAAAGSPVASPSFRRSSHKRGCKAAGVLPSISNQSESESFPCSIE